MKKKIAIITGATGGIGKEFVKQLLLEDVDEIWAIARNQQKLEHLKEEFGERVVPMSMDLSHIQNVNYLEEIMSQKNVTISYLVNNAGLAKMGSYKEFSKEEISSTIIVNCQVPVLLCKACIPFMERKSRIINLSSASAFQPNPYINLYASSKVFLRSYTRSLNVELKETGITATAACPSWVDTEMLSHEYNGKKIKFPGLVTAEQVVKKAVKDAKKGKDMSVCSFYVKCQHFNTKILPQKWIMKIWMHSLKKYL
jgi:short-subunit dehydrogenase